LNKQSDNFRAASGISAPPSSRVRRLLWFAALWMVSLAGFAALAYVFRLGLKSLLAIFGI